MICSRGPLGRSPHRLHSRHGRILVFHHGLDELGEGPADGRHRFRIRVQRQIAIQSERFATLQSGYLLGLIEILPDHVNIEAQDDAIHDSDGREDETRHVVMRLHHIMWHSSADQLESQQGEGHNGYDQHQQSEPRWK
jgi:hypothetical protein